jgi:hypothetical protein
MLRHYHELGLLEPAGVDLKIFNEDESGRA